MNTSNIKTRKVLVFEHNAAIPTVRHHLKQIEEQTGTILDIRIVTDLAGAQSEIGHADLAIIEVEGDGRHIAHAAFELGIPIVTTSLFFDSESFLLQTEKMKMIAKPQYFRFADAVKELLASIEADGGQLVITA